MRNVSRRARWALLAVAGLAVLTGCTDDPDPDAGTSASGTPAPGVSMGFEARALATGREFSKCAREHGKPDFPDPTFSNGGLAWPGATKAEMDAASASCATILQQLAGIPQQVDPPSAQTLGHMRQFAQCMREHGVPDWPDPKADGTFPLLGTPFAGMAQYSGTGVPQSVTDARASCIQFEVEWRIAAS